MFLESFCRQGDCACDHANQRDPAHDAGDVAELVERCIAQLALLEAHQPPAVTEAAAFGARREGQLLVQLLAAREDTHAEMRREGRAGDAEASEQQTLQRGFAHRQKVARPGARG
jgi:hypothetical protein